ncbi:MAG: hypothetical protein JOZ54_15450 [Acidobacteria bacterium]|nr:hypothetical protein [Acidobacteriota bacterium]
MLKRFLARAALLLLPIAAILIAWAFWWEPRRLVVRDEGVALPCWRAAPLRVAIVSDLHVGSPGKDVAQLDRSLRHVRRWDEHPPRALPRPAGSRLPDYFRRLSNQSMMRRASSRLCSGLLK